MTVEYDHSRLDKKKFFQQIANKSTYNVTYSIAKTLIKEVAVDSGRHNPFNNLDTLFEEDISKELLADFLYLVKKADGAVDCGQHLFLNSTAPLQQRTSNKSCLIMRGSSWG